MTDLQSLNDWRMKAAPSTRKALMLLASLYKVNKLFIAEELLVYEPDLSFQLALLSGFMTLDQENDLVFISESVRSILLESVPTSVIREVNVLAMGYFKHSTIQDTPAKEMISLQWLEHQMFGYQK